MAFVLPAFNLEVGIWRYTSSPTGSPPDVETVGNLSPGRLVSAAGFNPTTNPPGALVNVMILRLPAGTDIRDGWRQALPYEYDIVAVPLGTDRYYRVWYVDDIARGFANEHRYALIVKTDAGWTVPIA